MILKGTQRSGARQLALHLMNEKDNEHIHLHHIRGFMAEDVMGALNEAHALSRATKCRQFMYSLSLNPPPGEYVPISSFEGAISRIEEKLGLNDQPRVVVFHEKEGRRHAHCVWSRIDGENMKAINISHPKLKLQDISKALYLEHGWAMPKGLMDKAVRNPLNFTLKEWQQAKRTGQDPKLIKAALQQCWASSDNRATFEQALSEKGYFLARGDRRSFVAVDIYGEVYSLSRQLEQKKKDLVARLGNPEGLKSIAETKAQISQKLNGLLQGHLKELKRDHQKQWGPLLQAKHELLTKHRQQRALQRDWQNQRWQSEEQRRNKRIRHGFKGLWDKLNGKYWKMRAKNEKEAWECHLRDQRQREELIANQLSQRQSLQTHFNALRLNQEAERAQLIRNLSGITSPNQSKSHQSSPEKTRAITPESPSPDIEPEL